MPFPTPREKMTPWNNTRWDDPPMKELEKKKAERRTPTHKRPRSPLKLAEETYADNEWHLLIACSYDTRTAGPNAKRMLEWLLAQYKTPEDMQLAKQVDILRYFNALDMQPHAARMKQLADSYMRYPPKPHVVTQKRRGGDVVYESEVAHLTGLLRYGNDAWKIFCRDWLYGREWDDEDAEWREVVPEDPYLKAYVEWLVEEEKERKERKAKKKSKKVHWAEIEDKREIKDEDKNEINDEVKAISADGDGNSQDSLFGKLRLRLDFGLGNWFAHGLGLAAHSMRFVDYMIMVSERLFQAR